MFDLQFDMCSKVSYHIHAILYIYTNYDYAEAFLAISEHQKSFMQINAHMDSFQM